MDGSDTSTVIADLGEWSRDHPRGEDINVFIDTGVQYALEAYGAGFLVTDGHHNRVLQVGLDGAITELRTFGNTVPTGLEVSGKRVYMAEAGPVPHPPETGRVLTFRPPSAATTAVASGGSLLVDVELGRNRVLYAL